MQTILVSIVVKCLVLSEHRQPKLTPRRIEEFINYLWLSIRDVTFEINRYWVTSGRLQFETLYRRFRTLISTLFH